MDKKLRKISKEIKKYGYCAIFDLKELSLSDCYQLYENYNYKTIRTSISKKVLSVSKEML